MSREVYLKPTENIDSDHPAIRELVRSLTSDAEDQIKAAVTLFNYVRDAIPYNMYAFKPGASFRASVILQNGEGWCLQKAVLLAAMGRAADIPSRLVLAAIRNHKAPPEVEKAMGTDLFFPHTYNQFYLEGRWVQAAATFDRNLCQRIEVPVVEFDGKSDAILPPHDFNGQPYIEYVEHFGCFDDLPMPLIKQKCAEIYGDEFASYIASR